MSVWDSDGRLYGIPQGSTTEKHRAKIESQSGKAKESQSGKGEVATSDDVDGKDVNNVGSDRLTTYPSCVSLSVQDSGAKETMSTAKDSDIFATMSDNDSTSSWTMVQEKRRTRKVGRVKRLTSRGVT
jgi:hypothetical protein